MASLNVTPCLVALLAAFARPVERDAHGSELAPERAVLERGEEGIELGEMGGGGDASGKRALDVKRRHRDGRFT